MLHAYYRTNQSIYERRREWCWRLDRHKRVTWTTLELLNASLTTGVGVNHDQGLDSVIVGSFQSNLQVSICLMLDSIPLLGLKKQMSRRSHQNFNAFRPRTNTCSPFLQHRMLSSPILVQHQQHDRYGFLFQIRTLGYFFINPIGQSQE